jgi:hypothetical protein
METKINHSTAIDAKKDDGRKETKLNFFMILWLLFMYKKGRKGMII